jgi:HlyD family secretion protein
VLPKGSFSQETSGKWIFVVNGNKAEKTHKEKGSSVGLKKLLQNTH